MEGCPFCLPEAARESFAESALSRAVCNIRPILPGHSLIVPKRHVARLAELSDDELADLVLFGRRVTALLGEVFGATGTDWTIQDGAEAGQTVGHLHLHVIPRRWADLPDPGDWWKRLDAAASAADSEDRPALSDEERASLVQRLREKAGRLD